jgi:hypothetical protein
LIAILGVGTAARRSERTCDAATQYVALRYTERLAGAGALASIGTVGDSYDWPTV